LLLLLLIAAAPLGPHSSKLFWEHRYRQIACGLGGLVAVLCSFLLPGGVGLVLGAVHEYVSFIILIGALYVVAGGILIRVKGEATPFGNVVFLALGAVLANCIGTTGASMVLIRPYLRMNSIRISGYHVVFFIFIVSNCGGSLTPVGDPPLFLGYLRGVPFFWLVEHVLPAWLFVVGMLLAVFFALDLRAYRRIPGKVRAEIEAPDSWRFAGGLNVLLLLLLISSVFIPSEHFLREAAMLLVAFLSWRLTSREVHEMNRFQPGPLLEVAFLFLGIFLTMVPALSYLREYGAALGVRQPVHYYLASGALSSVLDNAPTYLNFLELARASMGGLGVPALLGLPEGARLIVAVSLGSVFFGAMTYIGNGPNFMVKSIADSAHVHTPDFLRYVYRYSLPVLLPILLLAGWLFL
jgi:Na+/H+ antiporter NhaD/arsenite permease-like protein